MPRANSQTAKEFSDIMTIILVETIGTDHCSPTAGTASVDLYTLHAKKSASHDPCLGLFLIFPRSTLTRQKKSSGLLCPCWSGAAVKSLVKIWLSVKVF